MSEPSLRQQLLAARANVLRQIEVLRTSPVGGMAPVHHEGTQSTIAELELLLADIDGELDAHGGPAPDHRPANRP